MVLDLRGGALTSLSSFFYGIRRVISLGTVQVPLLRGEVPSSGGEEGDQAASTPSLGLYVMTDKAAWKRQAIVARPGRLRVLSSRMVVGEERKRKSSHKCEVIESTFLQPSPRFGGGRSGGARDARTISKPWLVDKCFSSVDNVISVVWTTAHTTAETTT